MKTIPSAEFRKTYSQITEPVVVTVMGHPIGHWTPLPEYEEHPDVWSAQPTYDHIRPIRPVPKPGRK